LKVGQAVKLFEVCGPKIKG